MNGIGLNTKPFEDGNLIPEQDFVYEVARYLNGITSNLINIGGVSQTRHIEMLFGNLGDSLGGVSRNEVGRTASTLVIRYIANYMHKQGRLRRIVYTLKGGFEEDEEEMQKPGNEFALNVEKDSDIEAIIKNFENQRVKFKELHFDNGYSLMLDRQVKWQRDKVLSEVEIEPLEYEPEESAEEETGDNNLQRMYKFGVDLHSTNDNSTTMMWVAELKGGADPAGSDEHWKTATQALNRVITSSKETGRKVPSLSFIATILVERVAFEAMKWIETGKLKSVYNLTRIEENEDYRQEFLRDMEKFLGYQTDLDN